MLEIEKKEFEKVVDEMLTKIAIEIFKRSQENIRKFNAIDTGFLWRSGFVRIDKILEKEVGYTAPYSVYVEFGSEPHYVPQKPIFEWVRRKLKITSKKKANSVAWAIVKKISEEGVKPRPFLRKAIDEVKREMDNKVVVEIE